MRKSWYVEWEKEIEGGNQQSTHWEIDGSSVLVIAVVVVRLYVGAIARVVRFVVVMVEWLWICGGAIGGVMKVLGGGRIILVRYYIIGVVVEWLVVCIKVMVGFAVIVVVALWFSTGFDSKISTS